MAQVTQGLLKACQERIHDGIVVDLPSHDGDTIDFKKIDREFWKSC